MIACAVGVTEFNIGTEEELPMLNLWLSSVAQIRGAEPYFPLSLSILQADDRRVMNSIIVVIRNGLP